MASPPGAEISPRDMCRVLCRHKGKATGWCLAVLAVMVIFTALCPRSYRSESKLFVRLGRENVALDPTATMGQGPLTAVPLSREEEINSVVEILDSRVLAEAVVDRFSPEAIVGQLPGTAGGGAVTQARGPAAAGWDGWWQRINPLEPISVRDRALERYKKSLRVWTARQSNVVIMTYDAPSPELAQGILQTLVECYLERHLQLHRTPGAQDFFAAQRGELHERLQEAESRWRDLKNSTGVASVEERQRILVGRIGRLEDEELQTTARLAASEAELQALARRLAELPPTVEAEQIDGFLDAGADAMREQLYALQLQEQELLAKYTPEHYQVQQLRRQVEQAEQIVRNQQSPRTQVTRARSRAYDEMHLALLQQQTSRAALQRQATVLSEQLVRARSELNTLNDNAMQLARLQREVELQEANYRRYSENFEQARIDQALELERISNLSVVQPATLQGRAVWPSKLLNLALGLLAAVGGGMGLALVAERLDHSLQTPHDVEQRLGLPTLAAIPHLPPGQAGFNPEGIAG